MRFSYVTGYARIKSQYLRQRFYEKDFGFIVLSLFLINNVFAAVYFCSETGSRGFAGTKDNREPKNYILNKFKTKITFEPKSFSSNGLGFTWANMSCLGLLLDKLLSKFDGFFNFYTSYTFFNFNSEKVFTMKNKLFLSLIFLLFFSFKSFAATDGRGQIQLSEQAIDSFIDYITGRTSKDSKSGFNKPSTFWVTIDGSGSYWWYCKHGQCVENTANERNLCEKYYGQSCKRFARTRYVRWDNGINPKGKLAKFNSKMTSNEVRTKLTKLGFYNNDTTITSNIDETNIVSSSNKSLTEQLLDLSKLLEDGLITADEFTKAKKKLFN